MDSRTFKDSSYGLLAEVGRALSSPARLEILELLAQSPRTVDDIARQIAQSTANTSHHLQALRRARLVSRTKRGAHAVYDIAGPDVGALLEALQQVAQHRVAELDRLQRDYFREQDGLEPVDRDELLARMRRDDVVLLDVRPVDEYAAGHLPGAISMPLETLEDRIGELPADRTIVAYCRGPYCTFSAKAARRLRELGYDARRGDVGLPRWAGEPTSRELTS